MTKEIELDNGEVLEIAGILETMDLLGCTAEELYFWLDKCWLRQHCCETCGTSWPLLEDITGIAHLAEKYPKVGLNELVHKLHIENSREARQRQLQRRTASLAQTQRQADPHTDPRSQRTYGRRGPASSADYQKTTVVEPARGSRRARQLRPEELETRSYTTFEAEIPEEYEDQPRTQPEHRGLFGRRRR